MRILEVLLVRRRGLPRFDRLPPRVQRRLALAGRELSDAEAEMASKLGLAHLPRLLMVDEEEAVVISPADRAGIL